MKIQNQVPFELETNYDDDITKDFDLTSILDTLFVNKIFKSQPNTQIKITDNKKDLNKTDIQNLIQNCLSDTYQAKIENKLKELFSKCMIYTQKSNIPFAEIYPLQETIKENLPLPDKNTIYTPATDVIPVAKEVLAGTANPNKWFVCLHWYARPKTKSMLFYNESEFEEFKNWLQTYVSSLKQNLSSTANQLFNDFNKLKLNELTESLILRNDYLQNLEPYSFARILNKAIHYYTQHINKNTHIFAHNVSELISPKTIVFINLDQHAHSTPHNINQEWKIINNSINMKLKIMNQNKISKLTSAQRSAQKISTNIAMMKQNQATPNVRAQSIPFRSKSPTAIDLTKSIKSRLNKMSNVNRSHNIYKKVKNTYARPNRRNPDDFNKQGKMVSTKYRPDIHLYMDTSGSISERNYRDAVQSCIKTAKKLNINLYFNSFSHYMSAATLLSTRDKSLKQIYKEFQKVHKVTGGTDYEQIWMYINKSKKRQRELSLILTDFEYYPPSHYVKHPDNLFYVPISHTDWRYLTDCAKEFVNNMEHIDPKIRTKLLF